MTPTRIEIHGSALRCPDFATLFRSLLRRLRNLQFFHAAPSACAGDRELLHLAQSVQVETADVVWADQERLSHGRWMPQGGFVGDVTFAGCLAPFLPFLRLGELVHVGKGAAFGMGHYALAVGDGGAACNR